MRDTKLWFGLAVGLSVAACGGDDASSGSGGAGANGGTGGGAAGSGAVGGGGTGGASMGGSGGSGPTDTSPPSFAGLATATALTESRVQLSWEPAADETTAAASIAYRVYLATSAGGQDFSTPLLTTPAGAATTLVTELDPAGSFHFVVRAVDGAGNEDDNSVERSAETPDDSAPKFAGISSLVADTSRSLQVTWNPAFDRATIEANLRYRVYLGDPDSGVDFTTPALETAAGATTAQIPNRSPLTEYAVAVRAVDEAGNEDSNTSLRDTRTPEGESPAYLGATQAIATNGAQIKVYWAPAVDNVTEQANIVYDVYEALASNSQNFSSPSYTSDPGATEFITPTLSGGTRYYYVVRARDVAFNRDSNVIQVNAKTGVDMDNGPPTFAGVQAVVGNSPSTLEVSWLPATDDVTPTSRIVYDIYFADTSMTQSFDIPRLTTPAGATSAVISGLPQTATRFVVVRARDEADKALANTTEVPGTTLANVSGNTTAPIWVAGPVVTQVTAVSGRLQVDWTEATDDNHAAGEIRYHICAESNASDCEGTEFAKNIRYTSGYGETSVALSGLSHRTSYSVFVRPEDQSGNFETGNHSALGTTAVSYTENVLPLWQDQCNGCHTFQYATTVSVPGSYFDPLVNTGGQGLFLISPNKPEESLIYRRINPVGLQTPPFSPALPNSYTGTEEPRNGDGLTFDPLTGVEEGILREWIEQGAFAN